MSSMGYTPEAIDRVRQLARKGWAHGAVAAMVGWDLPRLQRFAEKHDIRFFRIRAKSKTPDPAKAGIRWDTELQKAFHGSKSIYLPPAQGKIFNAILEAGAEHGLNAGEFAKRTRVPKSQVAAHISAMRTILECIGITITHREYEIVRL